MYQSMFVDFLVLDSTGKIPSGLFLGDLSWMGTFDECVNTTATVYLGPNNTDPSHPFEGQYCKVGIPLSNQPAPAAAVVVCKLFCICVI